MATLWFCLLAFTFAGYVVLDGFDLGAGLVHLTAARTPGERERVLRSIGPVWDGNEVWLLAAGGTLYMAFPSAYAASMSGLYLPVNILLWLLILRALGVEVRSHVDAAMWRRFWDTVFGGASTILAFLLGAALGNVLRGVPIGDDGQFFVPLWTDLGVAPPVGFLDVYTGFLGAVAVLTLGLHGALWVVLRTDGDLAGRAGVLASRLWWGAAVGAALLFAATWVVQPNLSTRLAVAPWGWGLAVAAAGCLALVRRALDRGQESRAFLASAAHVAVMVACAAFTAFPYLLPATGGTGRGITAAAAATGRYGLETALWWWIPGMALVVLAFFNLYRGFRGKVPADSAMHH